MRLNTERQADFQALAEQCERIWAVIDLDAVESNIKAIRSHVDRKTKIIGVVKADGYGHGAVPVAKVIDPYVDGYAVAALDEGIQLRRGGIQKEILVLGTSSGRRFEEMLKYGIAATVFQYENAKLLSDMAIKRPGGQKAPVHIAVDTGMSRIGICPNEEGADEAARIAALPGIKVTGIFTHFARADEADKTHTEEQTARFLEFKEMLESRGVVIPMCHCSNSAAILELPEVHMDAVRAGIAIYGLYPSDEVDQQNIKLIPAMCLESCITFIKTIEPGTQVSYGGTFTADSKMRIATVAAGYGDGYPRSLSGVGEVLVRGRRAPVLGRICMDQFMIDVTHIPEASQWDRVTLAGRDGDQEITIEELAERSGGFHYEIPCRIGRRVPRVYTYRGEIVGVTEYMDGQFSNFCIR